MHSAAQMGSPNSCFLPHTLCELLGQKKYIKPYVVGDVIVAWVSIVCVFV